jgi:hypothetical protein
MFDDDDDDDDDVMMMMIVKSGTHYSTAPRFLKQRIVVVRVPKANIVLSVLFVM